MFHNDDDFDAFIGLLAQAAARFPVRVRGFCLLPNHFHLVLWPETDDGFSALMHWLLTTHASRYLRRYRATGLVWQGHFRASPIEEDDHLFTVLR
jgi:putative transposase